MLCSPIRLHHSRRASIVSRSSILSGKLDLGKLGEAVVVVGNAPHDRPGLLEGHLVGNRASFLCTKAPMLRANELSAWHTPSAVSSFPAISVALSCAQYCELVHTCR